MTAPKETKLAQLNEDIKRDYASRIGNSDFSLAVPYPRRVFAQEELDETLESLSLIPSTVLVVLPGRRGQQRTATSAPSPSGSSQQPSEGFVTKLIAMLVAFFTFLLSIFTGGSRQSGNQVTSGQMAASGGRTESSGANSGQGGDASGLRQRRLNRDENMKAKPESSGGNVHRLNTDDNDDDENNTWNGNSTQQM